MAFCTKCGSETRDEQTFCGSCGNPVASAPKVGVTPLAAPQAQRTEVSFYDSNDIVVTNTRVVQGGRTHALSGVTQVYCNGIRRPIMWPIIILLAGIINVIAHLGTMNAPGIIFGIFVALIGA